MSEFDNFILTLTETKAPTTGVKVKVEPKTISVKILADMSPVLLSDNGIDDWNFALFDVCGVKKTDGIIHHLEQEHSLMIGQLDLQIHEDYLDKMAKFYLSKLNCTLYVVCAPETFAFNLTLKYLCLTEDAKTLKSLGKTSAG